jgi:hypothetical protein
MTGFIADGDKALMFSSPRAAARWLERNYQLVCKCGKHTIWTNRNNQVRAAAELVALCADDYPRSWA